MKKYVDGVVMFMLLWLAQAASVMAAYHPPLSDTIRYDTSFRGIGPPAYNLPAPRSKQELLTVAYEKKQAEASLIISLLDKQQFYNNLKEIGYAAVGPASTSKSEAELQRIINGHQFAGNTTEAAGAQNSLAILLVRKDEWPRAEALFKEALSNKLAARDNQSALLILSNLALLNQHQGRTAAASGYFDQAGEVARKLKDKAAQGEALVGLAVEKARQHQYEEAERTIIRKAIPLFKSAHNLSGHIAAFKSLAMIYEMQQKYAQASWFYLQAKKLALPGLANSTEMAYIFYNLGHIKYLTGDSKLAVLDYKSAEQLARENNLLQLQLAIQDVLGNIYHQAGDYTAAVLALNEYNNLKNRIMESQNGINSGI